MAVSSFGERSEWALRLYGAAVGCSLAALATQISFVFDLYWSDDPRNFAPLATLGLASGLFTGFAYGVYVTRAGNPWLAAISVAVKAVIVGVCFCFLLLLAESIAEGGGTAAAPQVLSALFTLVFVVAIALLIALPVTTPIALMAVAVMRLATRRPRIAAVFLVAVVGITFGAITARDHHGVAARQERPGADRDVAIGRGQVRLTWTVENHSSRPLTVVIWQPESDGGWSASTVDIPACAVTSDRSAERVDWAIDVRSDDGLGERPERLTSADVVSGAEPTVWIVVRNDGRRTVQIGRTPTADELTASLCAPGSFGREE